jgi:hypothetical protein
VREEGSSNGSNNTGSGSSSGERSHRARTFDAMHVPKGRYNGVNGGDVEEEDYMSRRLLLQTAPPAKKISFAALGKLRQLLLTFCNSILLAYIIDYGVMRK